MTWPHDQSFWFLLFGSTNWLIKWISFLDFSEDASEEAQLIVFNLTKKSIFKTLFNFNFREISKANMMILKWEVIKRGPFSTAANSISACMKVASGSIRNIIFKKRHKQTKKIKFIPDSIQIQRWNFFDFYSIEWIVSIAVVRYEMVRTSVERKRFTLLLAFIFQLLLTCSTYYVKDLGPLSRPDPVRIKNVENGALDCLCFRGAGHMWETFYCPKGVPKTFFW